MDMAEFETSNIQLSVLIVAYRRWENVAQILESCWQAGVRDIYLSLDAPRDNNKEAREDQLALMKVVSDFETRTHETIKKRNLATNQGCAVNVILGCEWAFQTAEYLVVLEDDCLPSSYFFDFCRAELMHVKNDNTCWLLCGSQFAPVSITNDRVSLSKYALTWGWATHRSKWLEIREAFFSPSKFPEIKDLFSILPGDSFWNAGARRAIRGFTDVWDTVLLQRMIREGKYAILPQQNLVENVGNDQVSTHTDSDSPWVRRKITTQNRIRFDSPVLNQTLDEWLSQNFYQIRLRHSYSTKLTLALDLLLCKFRKRFKYPLQERLQM